MKKGWRGGGGGCVFPKTNVLNQYIVLAFCKCAPAIKPLEHTSIIKCIVKNVRWHSLIIMYYVFIDWVWSHWTGKIISSRAKCCPVWPDQTQSISFLSYDYIIIVENVVQPNGNVIDGCMRDNHKKDFSILIFFKATRNLQFMSVSVGLESKLRSAHINSSCSIQVCFY